MFGLVVLAVAALYFTVMFVAVRWAWRREIREGGTRGEAFRKALFVFLLIYLPVFWDHIPTLLVHRAMCAKDAGFTAYVDADDWRAKNAEAVSQLSRNERMSSVQLPKSSDGSSRYIGFGGLLRNDFKHERVVPWLSVERSEQRVADASTGKVLAVAIDYSSGHGTTEDLRSWLRTSSCATTPKPIPGTPVVAVVPAHILSNFERKLLGE